MHRFPRLCSMTVSCAAAMASLAAPMVSAAEAGDWLVRAGASMVVPKSDNGTLRLDRVAPIAPAKIEVDDGTSLTFNVSYFFTQNWAVELLAAWPFTHDFKIEGTGLHGEVDHLPPTLSMQYHFPVTPTIKPYVGLGVNWTLFSNEDISAPLDVDIDDSVGLAGQIGVDFDIAKSWLLNVEVRYIDIAGDLDVAGIDVGKVEVDPWVFGVNVGYRL